MNGQITVLFFASLAEQLNCRNLSLPYPLQTISAGELRDLLITQNGGSWSVLRGDQIRCAVNQEVVKMDRPLKPGDEVAFFPPVTGG